jgi:hypothetical protein
MSSTRRGPDIWMRVCATDCLNERVWRRRYRNLLTIARPEYIKDPTFVGVPAPGVVNPAAYLGGGIRQPLHTFSPEVRAGGNSK